MYEHEYEAMYGLENFYWWYVARRKLAEELLARARVSGAGIEHTRRLDLRRSQA